MIKQNARTFFEKKNKQKLHKIVYVVVTLAHPEKTSTIFLVKNLMTNIGFNSAPKSNLNHFKKTKHQIRKTSIKIEVFEISRYIGNGNGKKEM